ncbi:retrovirus-related Pol polyprotein from transposon TNT 1-94 [Trichonephila clavata]|uniref:Retrovirus-related Pol polyprotein from transposon TNT 1-94 n=1 Tax=Trichonephila clavata TaxID=2740835 RepID=A0A8X6FC57_TRICU|nr:retrovirus-related Pol polyprotein from transposon TNT 1-94 [Trichonephila clavata]
MANYSIPKLEGQNYVSWANDVKYLLMERQVWNIVDEKEIEPKLDVSTDAEAVKEVKNFKARKQIAMSIIYLNIDSSHRRIVERIDDPVEAWKVLKTYYQPDSKAHHMEMKILVKVTFQLLRYLPPQFDSKVQTILRLDDVKFVYKDVVAELVAEEARLKLRNMDMNKQINAQSTRMEKKKRSIKTCYQCQSPDHLKNNCSELTTRRHFTPRNVKGSYQHGKRCQSPTRQRQSRNNHRCSNQTPNQRNNFHHRDVSPATGKYSNFITTSLNIVDESADWVFDTAASHHFCRNRDYFDEFYPLISGPQLDKKGISFCNCRGRGEVEIAEDGKVLFSAYLKNGVYHLYPKVLGPRKRITFEASALMDKKLEFWHKRLAHVSPSVISRTVKENGARGLPNFKNFELKCEPCQLNKQQSIPFQKPHSGAVLEPVYLKFEPFEPFPDEDSRHERIVKDASDKSSVATPESSEDETDEDSSDTHKPSTKTVNCFRKLVPRPSGSHTDVYYYQEGCTKRLRTLKDIEKYCKDHNLTFDSDIFNFSQPDTFHWVIDGSKGVATSSLSQT